MADLRVGCSYFNVVSVYVSVLKLLKGALMIVRYVFVSIIVLAFWFFAGVLFFALLGGFAILIERLVIVVLLRGLLILLSDMPLVCRVAGMAFHLAG